MKEGDTVAFIRAHQLNIMVFMSGICCILAFMTLMIESLPRRRKSILVLMELSAMLLLLFDRESYIFRGNESDLGYFMVRFSNGMVFFMSIFIPHLVTQYLKDLYQQNDPYTIFSVTLKICDLLFAVGTALIVVSQFTGLYYTFDASNNYQRAPRYVLSYVFPVLIVMLDEIFIYRHSKQLSKGYVCSLSFGIALPTIFSFVQIFFYGMSLTSLTIVLMIIMFYFYALNDLNHAVTEAREKEIKMYKEAERREAALFEQTAEALANAIDAKDKYTHGHSTRVALISKKLAMEAGFSDNECREVYFAALLHDVGKIGVKDRIINKADKLTDEEFEQVKIHPVLGDQILSSIRQSPALRIGARYHHERYDGRGYPDGLRGDAIPETARIIAVADAYDAMSSRRSYRDPLSEDVIRNEIAVGMGTQFDPKYAGLMLRIIDSGEVN